MSKKLSDSDERLFEKSSELEGKAGGDHVRTMSLFQGTAALTKTAVGAGLLSLATTFAYVGIVPGIILLVFGAVTTLITLYFYGRLSYHLNTGDFVTIARRCHGRTGEIIVVISILAYLLGPMVAYIRLGGSWIAALIKLWSGTDSLASEGWLFSIIISGAIIFPLSFLNDMSKLSHTSIIGMVFMLYVVMLTTFDYVADKAQGVVGSVGGKPNIVVEYGEASAFGKGSGVHMLVRALYTFCCMLTSYISHTSIPSICHSLVKPTPKRRFTLMAVSTTVTFMLYLLAALFGYLHFGDRLLFEDSDMILVQKLSAIPYQIALLGVSLVLAVSYPLILLPFRESVDWLVCVVMKREVDKVPIFKSPKKILINLGVISLTCLIACVVKSAVFLFAIAGAFGGMIGFTLPALYLMKLSDKINVKKWERITCYFMIVLGIIVFIGGLVSSIIQFTNPSVFGISKGSF